MATKTEPLRAAHGEPGPELGPVISTKLRPVGEAVEGLRDLAKRNGPELHCYWTTRDRVSNLRLFRVASEILKAIEAGVFHPVVG